MIGKDLNSLINNEDEISLNKEGISNWIIEKKDSNQKSQSQVIQNLPMFTSEMYS